MLGHLAGPGHLPEVLHAVINYAGWLVSSSVSPTRHALARRATWFLCAHETRVGQIKAFVGDDACEAQEPFMCPYENKVLVPHKQVLCSRLVLVDFSDSKGFV